MAGSQANLSCESRQTAFQRLPFGLERAGLAAAEGDDGAESLHLEIGGRFLRVGFIVDGRLAGDKTPGAVNPEFNGTIEGIFLVEGRTISKPENHALPSITTG